jgi:uncharacterized OB-fold protein
MTTKPVPVPTPNTEPYFDYAARGELRVPRCLSCGLAFFYPRTACPSCASEDLEWMRCSGRAKLHTYLINTRPAPGFEEDAPHAIAVVELEEGPRMMSNIVECPQTAEALVLDMDLEVVFDKHGDVAVPKFKPSGRVS